MSESVRLVSPEKIVPNPQNPRIIFREDELVSLMNSISDQGILVPLTVFENKNDGFTILDGERRWRCSLRLGLSSVPVIVQPEPEPLQNIMMMFAIHNTKRDWDPLPTAMKLGQLEEELEARRGKKPTEALLAASASMKVGEVRRLRRILNLPEDAKSLLMEELKKPRHLQVLTVDHFLETRRGTDQLAKKGAISKRQAEDLNSAIILKFKEGVERSTVAPRSLPKIARAYERRDIDKSDVQRVVTELIRRTSYTIDRAYLDIAVAPEENRKIESAAKNLSRNLKTFMREIKIVTPETRDELRALRELIDEFLN